MNTEDATATGALSPRTLAFYAARNAIIDECKQRKAQIDAEIDRERTDRLAALRAEYEAGLTAPVETHDDAPDCRECGTWPCGLHATAQDIAEYEARGGSV